MSSIRRMAILILCLFGTAALAEEPLAFGVLNQRSALLTAQYWNPILAYVSARSGVPLRLKMGRTAPETTAMTRAPPSIPDDRDTWARKPLQVAHVGLTNANRHHRPLMSAGCHVLPVRSRRLNVGTGSP